VLNHNPHGNIAATITYHHLRLTLDDVLKNKLRPHHYCKPVAKTPYDREALRMAAFCGNPHFFLGSDSAPHRRGDKECSHGCAGVYTAPVLAPGLVDYFDKYDRLHLLENFACSFGPQFYGVDIKDDTPIYLTRQPWKVPDEFEGLVPFHAGEELNWTPDPHLM
jgi:dihydroorotase